MYREICQTDLNEFHSTSMGKIAKGFNEIHFTMLYGNYCYIFIFSPCINQFVFFFLSDQQIGLMLARNLQFAYRDFAKDVLSACGQNTKLADVPIQFNTPIYGSQDPSFTDFVAPGVILT